MHFQTFGATVVCKTESFMIFVDLIQLHINVKRDFWNDLIKAGYQSC